MFCSRFDFLLAVCFFVSGLFFCSRFDFSLQARFSQQGLKKNRDDNINFEKSNQIQKVTTIGGVDFFKRSNLRAPRPAPSPLRPPRAQAPVRPWGRTAAHARARCAPTPTLPPRSGAGSLPRPATPPRAGRGAAGGPVGAAAMDLRPPRITGRAAPLRTAPLVTRVGGAADFVSHRAPPRFYLI